MHLVFFLFVGEQHVLIECVCVFVLCVVCPYHGFQTNRALGNVI